MVVMSVVGGAIDFGRAMSTRDQMQNAVDASVLAAARVWQTEKNLALAEQKGREYYATNKPKAIDSVVTNFTSDAVRNALVMNVQATVPTPFLSVIMDNGLTVKARAEALLAVGGNGENNLEIAMMLDVTGSMSNGKIDDLKAAAKDLIDIVVWQDQSEYTSRVALVPFANAVNLGSTSLVNSVRGSLKTGSCTSTSSPCTSFTTSSSPSSSQWTRGAPARYYRFTRPDGDNNTWQASSYCVTERTGTDAYTDAAPDSASRRVQPLYGGTSASSCGYMDISTGDLEVNSIQPLSSDKTMLKRRIDKMEIAGSTAGQMGTAWAWYMLSPKWSYLWPSANRPSAYNAEKTQKIAVLMTDGEYNTGHCNGVVANNSGSGSGGNSTKINCSANNTNSNSQAQQLCTAMKNGTGITVYTVGFALGGNTTAINTLRNCASDTSKFYEADNGEALRAAFRDIALQVAKLRLSQ
jgi:Flp pilus assembly protein TadG